MNTYPQRPHVYARMKRTVLVEDDQMLGNLLLEILQEEEIYQVSYVLNAEEALSLLQTETPELVLMDINFLE
ncbi:response regulator [Ktedonospora formicarum]|uniref:Response regulatory domain-containing protein n=1 Tax=Ktedonospora formicarum TaxID=2778364 RepID=A0A8J3IAB6_9CHLR|nr:response regulator [Ktedonospora formicarum]GHO48937.1 hypothetical protein KSX_71000 [Ktedonospora formicarum]